jgi:hypothetical protein
VKPTRRTALDGRDSVWLTSVHSEGANRSRPRGLYGVKNIHLAIFLIAFFRENGIDVELDIGQQGWPITLWIEPATFAKSRRLIIETLW